MLEKLRKTLLDRVELLEVDLIKEYIQKVQFCVVNQDEMISIGGKDEQIACIGNKCYITNTYLGYTKHLQRIYFLVEYVNMFSYLEWNSQILHEVENLTNKEVLRRFLDSTTPIISSVDTRVVTTMKHPYLAQDIDRALDPRKVEFTCLFQTTYNLLVHSSSKPINKEVNKISLNDNKLTIEFDVSNLIEIKRACVYACLPKPTLQKACLNIEDMIVNNNKLLGEVAIILDTKDVCVLQITRRLLIPDYTPKQSVKIVTRNAHCSDIYYYHYPTKRFVSDETSAYKTFQKNYGAILELQLAINRT